MTISKKILISTLATLGFIASTAAALAVPANATVSVNVRSGPGTSFNVLDVLFAGETVDVTECVSNGWCRIEHSGPDGWVSSTYLQAPAPPPPPPAPTPTPSGPSDPECSFGLVLGPNGPSFSISCGDNPAPPPPPPPPPPPAIEDKACFFTGANFSGQSFCRAVGTYNSLPDMAIYNDEISSIQLFGNAKVDVWKHINQNGLSHTFVNSKPTLPGNINNQLSSFRVFTGPVAPPPAPPVPAIGLNGEYTIQQVSNGRYLDAHEGSNDNSAVTRNNQNNATQRWRLTPLGNNKFTIQQVSNGRYLDAHTGSNDFSAVTRNNQNNNTQRWTLVALGNDTYTIQQVSNGRYLDAHTSQPNDYSAVTRENQNNNTQRWIIKAPAAPAPVVLNGEYTIRQKSNGRYLDAHTGSNDFSAVTRNNQNNDTQRWIITPLGNGRYTIQQKSNGRYLDAHTGSNDFSAVTRNNQNNNTQRWILTPLGNNTYTVQQVSNGRYLDAHTSQTNDFSAVTRNNQNNNTQRWIIQ